MGHENSSLINRGHRAVAHTSRLGRGRNGPARLAPWGALVTAICHRIFGDLRALFSGAALYTDRGRMRGDERSGDRCRFAAGREEREVGR